MENGSAVFKDESQISSIYIDYLRNRDSRLEREPGCPNHSDRLTYEDFAESVDMLAEPYSRAMEASYAS